MSPKDPCSSNIEQYRGKSEFSVPLPIRKVPWRNIDYMTEVGKHQNCIAWP